MSRTLSHWRLVACTPHMNASAIREMLKLTERADIISFCEALQELA